MQLVKQMYHEYNYKPFYGVDNAVTVSSVPDDVTAEVSVMKGYYDVSLLQICHTYSAVQNVEVLDLQSR